MAQNKARSQAETNPDNPTGNPRTGTRPRRPISKRLKLPTLLVRIPEAAEMARMSVSSFYKLLNRGVIPRVTIDSMTRIPVAALERFVSDAMQDADQRKRA
jgi:hypothetical protein